MKKSHATRGTGRESEGARLDRDFPRAIERMRAVLADPIFAETARTLRTLRRAARARG